MLLADATLAQEWRGIIPLHSTRADVIRLLGQPDHNNGSYDVSDGRIFILYAEQPCEHHYGLRQWNVPPDTVLVITLKFKQSVRLEELSLDLNKFSKEPGHHGQVSYRNDEEGIVYDGWFDRISSISYVPKKSDESLLCKEGSK
jgi:hypothetical protein